MPRSPSTKRFFAAGYCRRTVGPWLGGPRLGVRSSTSTTSPPTRKLHVSGMVEDGDELPSPSSLEVIMADPENSDAVAILVTLPEAVDRTVRVNITLTERLLRRIDEHAKNRSAFLARAAEKALAES